jgi:hypothetical protein
MLSVLWEIVLPLLIAFAVGWLVMGWLTWRWRRADVTEAEWATVTVVPRSSATKVTSTVVEPGGTPSLPSQPQVNTIRSSGTISTYSPAATASGWIVTRIAPPGSGSMSAAMPCQRTRRSGSTKYWNTVAGLASMWTASSTASLTDVSVRRCARRVPPARPPA